MPGRRTDKFYIDKANKYSNGRYNPTGVVNRNRGGNTIKVEVICNRCHQKYEVFANTLSNPNKSNCSWCSGRHELNTEIAQRRVGEKTHGKIQIVGKYISRHAPLDLECNVCGNTWTGDYGHIMLGRGCPQCASSSGEQVISSILDYNNIEYSQQERIYLRGRLHQVDKVVRDCNDILCVIQPDGEQHYWVTKQIDRNGKDAEKEFNHRVSMDRDENELLPALGIRVLRIPWIWFDLDDTFTLLRDFLGYDLKKPGRDYVPMYKRVKEMAYAYLESYKMEPVIKKYKVSRGTLTANFRRYFGMNKTEYIKAHPECKKSLPPQLNKSSKAVVSIDSDENKNLYYSLHEAESKTGISCSNISSCIHGKHPTAGGLHWEFAKEDDK